MQSNLQPPPTRRLGRQPNQKPVDVNSNSVASAPRTAIIGVDQAMVIEWFAGDAESLLGFKRGDIGRRIVELSNVCNDPMLGGDCQHVSQTGQPVEREVGCEKHGRLIRQIAARRTAADRVGGLVVTWREVTSTARDEEPLRSTRQRFRRSAAVDGIAILFFDEDRRLIDCNDWFLSATGYSRPEVTAGELAVTCQLGPYEQEFDRRDGSSLAMILTGQMMEDRTVVVHGIELPDQKRAEAELRESRQRLRLAAGATKLGWYSYEAATEQVIWSDELRMMIGIAPREPVTMRRILDSVLPIDRERFLQHSVEALQNETVGDYRGEFRMERSDGRIIWVEDRGTVVYQGPTNDRRPDYAVGMVMDVTDRKDAEARLMELNRTLEDQVTERTATLEVLQSVTRVANGAQTVVEAMHAAMVKLASINGWEIGHVWQAAETTDGPEPAVVMKSLGVWHADSSAKSHVHTLEQLKRLEQFQSVPVGQGLIGTVARTGQPLWTWDGKDAGPYHVAIDRGLMKSAIAFPITMDGEVAAVMEFLSTKSTGPSEDLLKVIPDIGIQLGHVMQRKRLEQIVAEMAIQEQQRIGRELHDGIAQQLTGGAMIAEPLRRRLAAELPSQADTAKQLFEIFNQAHSGVRHLSSGLLMSTMNADELLPALRATATETLKRFGVRCDIHADDFDESVIDDSRVALAMLQIAREAIHNAVKHSGAQRIRIEVRAGRQIEMTFGDDGVGFDRAANTKGGNGLRIMRYRAQAIGGQLTVRSRPGEGTHIRFTLPVE